MARFKYRMQSILDIKEKLEEQARMEFATAKVRLNEEEEKLQILIDRKDAYEEEGRSLQKDSLPVREILDNREAIERMKEYIDVQIQAVRQAEIRMDEAREKLTIAMQESKTHQKLRENAFVEFMKEEEKKESKEVDELTSYTYGQKK